MRIPVPQGPKPQAIIRTPVPQKTLSRVTRVLLQCQYNMWPEAVEGHLHELQNETPSTERYNQLVDDLHTQLYDVPAKFYRRLVCSLPLELRHTLRKLRHYTYKCRMVENRWGLKEQHKRDQQEKINLRAQVRSLTGDNQNLRQQLATCRELKLEIAVLKDQVAAYRHLCMAGMSAYVSTDSTNQ
ncbi:hypothetical protein ABVT39_014898 [Epinephelus coioides]